MTANSGRRATLIDEQEAGVPQNNRAIAPRTKMGEVPTDIEH